MPPSFFPPFSSLLPAQVGQLEQQLAEKREEGLSLSEDLRTVRTQLTAREGEGGGGRGREGEGEGGEGVRECGCK